MSVELLQICATCKHVHNEELEGKLEELPKDFVCPDCGSNKENYYNDLWFQV